LTVVQVRSQNHRSALYTEKPPFKIRLKDSSEARPSPH